MAPAKKPAEPQGWEPVDTAPGWEPVDASTTLATEPDRHEPEARTVGNYGSEIMYGAGRGIKNDVVGAFNTVAHPIKTASDVYSGTVNALEAAKKEEHDLQSTYPRSGVPPTRSIRNNLIRGNAALLTFLEQNPLTGSVVQKAESGNGIASPESVGAGVEGAVTVGAPELLGKGVSAAVDTAKNFRPKSSPEVVTPSETNAREVAGVINPPGGVKPSLIRSIQRELPGIKDYAKRTNNPLNTQAELLKAAQGYSKEGLDHFNNLILGPLKDIKVGEDGTLGQINKRISDINDNLRKSDVRAASGGQALSFIEQSGLENELGHLQSVLYDNLSKRTGIPVESLKELRQSYGGGFSLKDSLEAAENARLTREHSLNQRGSSTPMDKGSLLKHGLQKLKGGEQAIADRSMQKALAKHEATPRNLPQPKPANPEADAAARTSAQGEALRAHEGETTSQAMNAKKAPLVQELSQRNSELKRLQDSEKHLASLPEHPTTSQTLAKVRAQIKSTQADIGRINTNLRSVLAGK